MNTLRCKKYLQNKISINMKKWKYDKRFKSQKQALAVSYSQTRDYCNRLNKSRKNKKSTRKNKKSTRKVN